MTRIRSAFSTWTTLIFLVFATRWADPGFAQQMVINSDMQFDYAMTLYQEQDYDTAQTEFKRFVHFFPDDSRVVEAMFKTGMALFQQHRFFDAARQFNRIIEDQKIQDPFTRESYFMQSRAFVKLGNLGYGQLVLQNFLKLTEDIALQDRIYLELAQIHIQASRSPGIDELDQAQTSLEKISPARARNFKVDEQTAMIRKVRAAPEKNPALAGLLALIPGGGFLYCERFKDAAVAFALNTGLLLGAYTAFDNGNPALGGVISFMEAGFYSAGIYGSISAAHKHNHALKIRILDREFNVESTLTGEKALLSLNHPF